MSDERNNSLPWKYCVVGNIKKTHVDENGILRYGTAAYTGGTKVYLCGKLWDNTRESITVIGLNRKGHNFQVHEVPVNLIENVRYKKVYNSAVISIMNDIEFHSDWWGDTLQDKFETETFVAQWKNR